jgi:predicted dehydrogenase
MKAKIGVIGCGNISGAYFKAGKRMANLDIVACADLDVERAKAKAKEFGVPKGGSVEALLADPDIKIVVNLTIPKAHAQVALAALKAGKHVYNEKPLAVSREDGKAMLDLAASKGLRVGGAPDTFLGGGHQTCRKLVDEGWIGKPVAGTAFMTCHGHESWHPDPEFYYKVGGGPLFDMGPYYLTALVNLLGPVKRATGSARVTFPERLITSEPKQGQKIQVDVPTHVAGVLEFESGAIVTLLTSFDVWHAELPCIEIYGTEGSMSVPDPNGFGGSPKVRRAGAEGWSEIPLSHVYAENSRGLGVADMASALAAGRPQRASGELTYHVLDVMHAIHDASREGKHAVLGSRCDRPAPLPLGLRDGEID